MHTPPRHGGALIKALLAIPNRIGEFGELFQAGYLYRATSYLTALASYLTAPASYLTAPAS